MRIGTHHLPGGRRSLDARARRRCRRQRGRASRRALRARLRGPVAAARGRRPQPRPLHAGGGPAVPGEHAGRRVRVDGHRHVLRARLGAAQGGRQGSRELPLHRARAGSPEARRRAAPVARQPEGRRARGHRLLHRPGHARARLQARHDAQGGEGRRRQVPGAQDQRQGRRSSSPNSWSRSGSERGVLRTLLILAALRRRRSPRRRRAGAPFRACRP